MIAALYSLPTTIEPNRMCICNQVKRAEVRMRARPPCHPLNRPVRWWPRPLYSCHPRSALPARSPALLLAPGQRIKRILYEYCTATDRPSLPSLHANLRGASDRFGDYLSVDCAYSLRINERNQLTNTKFTGPNTQIAKHTSR